MKQLKYPIGIQTFPKIIEEGYLYVDKSRFVKELLDAGSYIFLSRPRRFGKSLLLSMLHAYFEGRKELFKGLEIYDMDVDWTPSPVLHFDLNAENYLLPGGLENILDRQLRRFENIYGADPRDTTPSQRFTTLIENASRHTGRKVVILVDEYDKPLLGLEENDNLFIHNQALLKAFFGNLKSMDRNIRFAILTGVARFNKVSIFSDLNNLNDISLSERFAEICGLTEEELTATFAEGIRSLAEKRGEEPSETLQALRSFYDGYLFSEEGRKVYNPYSVILALNNRRIEPYWFETGTPTFLAKRIKERGIGFTDLDGIRQTREDLLYSNPGTSTPVSLLFQTGYLSIDHYNEELQAYSLRFPNREVETGFARQLLPLYAPEVLAASDGLSFLEFRHDLSHGDPGQFMRRVATLLKNFPPGKYNENVYRNLLYMLCIVSATEAQPERQSYKGRSDLEVYTRNFIYVFEFKYDKSPDEAMAQLLERDYAGRFDMDSRKVFLIGASFSDRPSDRGLSGWQIMELQ